VLLSIQGGSNLGIFEINDAAQLVKEAAHPEANIIFGTVIDDTLGDEVRVTVIAAGFDGGEPQARIEPIAAQRPLSQGAAPVIPSVPADEAARELAEVDEKETVSVSISSSAGDSVFGDDDLDVPDFLK
jgi:cell division protein FtsZ